MNPREEMALKKPLVFFDLEATGVSPVEDRIVDIALIKRNVDGTEESFSSLVDPETPIPPESQAVHHISDEMVRGQPTFRQLAPRVAQFIGDADLGGFGVIRYDVPLLTMEFKRAGLAFGVEGRAIIDTLTIFHRKEPRNLGAAYRFYCGKTLDGAHRAAADTQAAYEVFWQELARYPDLPRDIEGINAFCRRPDPGQVDSEGRLVWRNGKACFNFGKYRTWPLEEVARCEPAYLERLVQSEKTSPEVARICRQALMGVFPSRAAK